MRILFIDNTNVIVSYTGPHSEDGHCAITSDGAYLYIHTDNGLYKVGSGYSSTIKVSCYKLKQDFQLLRDSPVGDDHCHCANQRISWMTSNIQSLLIWDWRPLNSTLNFMWTALANEFFWSVLDILIIFFKMCCIQLFNRNWWVLIPGIKEVLISHI